MLSLIAQAVEVVAPVVAPPVAGGGLSTLATVLVSLFGAAGIGTGFWGWMKIRTSKQLDNEGAVARQKLEQEGTVLGLLMNQIAALQQEIGGLKEKIGRLTAEVDDLRRENEELKAREKRLAEASLKEINRLRAELGVPPLEKWPPEVV